MGDSFKDIDRNFKALDESLGKIFKPERKFTQPKPVNSNHFQRHQERKKLLQKNDIETIKTIAKGTNDTIQKIYKAATKNKIPKDYEEIMAMRDRLELEKKQRLDIIEAKKRIQELLKEKKEETKAQRKQRINKIKSIITKVTKH